MPGAAAASRRRSSATPGVKARHKLAEIAARSSSLLRGACQDCGLGRDCDLDLDCGVDLDWGLDLDCGFDMGSPRFPLWHKSSTNRKKSLYA